MSQELQMNISHDLVEKIILQNDVAGMTSIQKVDYVKNLCDTMGLNPLTKPIQLIKFQNKEMLYITKDGTEQLRKINKISITKIETKVLEGGVYVATATATDPAGRQDSSTGVVNINGLRGDALANAIMKGETKAKRRVTLSICGLGFLDESELETMPNIRKVDIHEPTPKLVEVKSHEEKELNGIEKDIEVINNCSTLDELKKAFLMIYPIYKGDSDAVTKLVEAKDLRKKEIEDILIREEI